MRSRRSPSASVICLSTIYAASPIFKMLVQVRMALARLIGSHGSGFPVGGAEVRLSCRLGTHRAQRDQLFQILLFTLRAFHCGGGPQNQMFKAVTASPAFILVDWHECTK